MKKNSNFFLTGKFIMLFALCIVYSSVSLAQDTKTKNTKKKKFKFKPDINLEFEARTTYDDNILKYSEKYLDRFMNREDEGRFQIKTDDDVISRPSLIITASQKLIKNFNTTLQFSMNRSFYINNGIKSWSFFDLSLEHYFHKKGYFSLSYNYIPNFYIRHYRDDDYVTFVGYVPESFKPMSFAKENYSFNTQYVFLKNTGIRLTLDYIRYFYNVHYIEYDSNDFSYEIRILQPLSKKLRMQAAYSFTKSYAKGFDEAHETRETSNDADASFFDNDFALGLRFNLPSFLKMTHSLWFDGSYGKRSFTSPKYVEFDQLHAGRIDYNYRLALQYRFKINKALNASIFYNYFGRRTSSRSELNKEFISLEKDYNQNQIGFSLIYNYKLNYGKKKKQ